MAYLKEITLICRQFGCTKTAVVALHNHRNELINEYCRAHGNEVLKRIKKEEGQS